MNDSKQRNEAENRDFKGFLEKLRHGDTKTWTHLVGKLKAVTVPWLLKRIGRLPEYSLVSEIEFANEVFAESLAKFYPLFNKGEFKKYQDLQSLMFRISELKMKEGFAKNRKNSVLYRPGNNNLMEAEINKTMELTADDEAKKEKIQVLQIQIQKLSEDDQKLLQRFYAGEKMVDIAQEMKTSEANIRKRKQRALERLKKLLT